MRFCCFEIRILVLGNDIISIIIRKMSIVFESAPNDQGIFIKLTFVRTIGIRKYNFQKRKIRKFASSRRNWIVGTNKMSNC